MRRRPLALSAAWLAVMAVTGGCGDDGEPAVDVVLPEGDACGDAFFWAATEAGDTAVTVTLDGRDRSTQESTTIELEIPDPAIDVRILRGRELSRNFCTDVLDVESEPESRRPAVEGRGTVTLDAAPAETGSTCGSVHGELQLDGLVADDGTRFAPIRVTSNAIGCYSG